MFGHFSRGAAILEFFSNRKVAELAKILAQGLAKRCPPAIANNPVRMVPQQRLSDILEDTFAPATQFTRENKLGWYKRGKLGRRFRWELIELGYDKKFVDTAVTRLIACVTRHSPLSA